MNDAEQNVFLVLNFVLFEVGVGGVLSFISSFQKRLLGKVVDNYLLLLNMRIIKNHLRRMLCCCAKSEWDWVYLGTYDRGDQVCFPFVRLKTALSGT